MRGNSIHQSSGKGKVAAHMSQTTVARRRTTITQTSATPFELRAIRLNTYLNVIVNSASVSDLITLIKKALLV